MTTGTEKVKSTSEREIVISRLFNAPRELVFEVWTDPKHLINWWGPKGFTNTFESIEIKPGGVWKFTMHGPDGTDYPNLIVFKEVVKPEKLVYNHGSEDVTSPGSFFVTVTFEDKGKQTLLTMTSLFQSKEERDYVVENFRAIEGGNQTLDKLEAELKKLIA